MTQVLANFNFRSLLFTNMTSILCGSFAKHISESLQFIIAIYHMMTIAIQTEIP